MNYQKYSNMNSTDTNTYWVLSGYETSKGKIYMCSNCGYKISEYELNYKPFCPQCDFHMK